MPALRFGTCSWSEKSWVGPFYSAGTKPGDYLAHRGTQFDSVEADSTYYACPPADRVRNWHAVTPCAFVMSMKLPQTAFLGDDARELDAGRILRVEEFAGAVQQYYAAHAGLAEKAGPVVLQLPWLPKTIFRDLGEFLERLDPFLAALPTTGRLASRSATESSGTRSCPPCSGSTARPSCSPRSAACRIRRTWSNAST